MQYKSERIFEAGYRIGSMYAALAADLARRQGAEKDPIAAALARKDMFLAASSVVQSANLPYLKVIDLSSHVDSMSPAQSQWADSSVAGLSAAYRDAGMYRERAIGEVENAPIPREVSEQPLYLFQYRKQLLETVNPMKAEVRDYYLNASKEAAKNGVTQAVVRRCREEFARYNFLVPNGYDSLAGQILIATDELPAGLPDDEREELVFQFEDIVFELQDKALFEFEDALARADKEGVTGDEWYARIKMRLGKLNPEKFGRELYVQKSFVSSSDWFARCDSVAGWTTSGVTREGWHRARSLGSAAEGSFGPGAKPEYVGGNCTTSVAEYLWRPFFLEGEVREASLYFATARQYQIYLNDILVSDGSAGGRRESDVDSMQGMASIVKGGDNVLSVRLMPSDGKGGGMAVMFRARIDTASHFESALKLPILDTWAHEAKTVELPQVKAGPEETAQKEALAQKPVSQEYAATYRNKGEMLNAITGFQARAQKTQTDIRRERLEVQKLEIKRDLLNKKVLDVKKEIEQLKEGLRVMDRER
jgi:hypothetical protein